MLETGLESIAYNLNRKNNDLKFFDFGKTYSTTGSGKYHETEHLCLYITGNVQEDSWRNKSRKTDLYFLKGMVMALMKLLGMQADSFGAFTHKKLYPALQIRINGSVLIQLGAANTSLLSRFDIKQPVFFADFNWNALIAQAENSEIKIEEVPKFPVVFRDLALVVPNQLKYEEAEKTIRKLKLKQLQNIQLFDVFESDKLGEGKKSMAISPSSKTKNANAIGKVSAPSADNNPQFVSVILSVLPPGSNIGPLVQPIGLIFSAVAYSARNSRPACTVTWPILAG